MMSSGRRRLLALLLLLALSIGLNVALGLRARGYYLELNRLALDPLGLGVFGSGATPEGDAALVVFFGDSRAAQWPAPEDLSSFRFLNRGIGNQTSAQILARFDAHIAPLRPDILVLQAGINDLKAIPLFPERKRAIVADCEQHLRQIVQRARAQGTVVILTTIFPVGPVPLERRPFWSDDVALAVEEVNAFLVTLQGPGVLLLDSHAILAENGAAREAFAHDTLHLNAQGYAALNRALVARLQQP